MTDDPGQQTLATNLGVLREELIRRFGGATIYSSAPAEGLWKDHSGEAVRDRIVLVKVMSESLDWSWWRDMQQRLETEFSQEAIIIRILGCESLE